MVIYRDRERVNSLLPFFPSPIVASLTSIPTPPLTPLHFPNIHEAMPRKGSKRKAATQPTATGSFKQTKHEDQKNVSKSLSIPVDEGVQRASGLQPAVLYETSTG